MILFYICVLYKLVSIQAINFGIVGVSICKVYLAQVLGKVTVLGCIVTEAHQCFRELQNSKYLFHQ